MISKIRECFHKYAFVQFLAVFLFAFAIRFFFLQLRGYSFLGIDETVYTRWGHAMADDFGSGMPGWDKFFMPGWPMVLACMFTISNKIYFARFCVVIIGSIDCGMVFLIGKDVFNYKTGLLAGLIIALLPEHIFYSHYLQAEIGLEFIIVGSTLTLTRFFRSPLSRSRLLLASFLFGAGVLFKHFTLLPFAALWRTCVAYLKTSRTLLIVMPALFIAPLVIYSCNLYLQGRDYLMFINTPVKNLNEWSVNRPRGLSFLHQGRMKTVGEKVHAIKGRGLGFFYSHVRKNFFNLWTPNSLPISRLYRHNYSWGHYPRRTGYVFVAGYSFIMFFGLLGLCFNENTPFKMYAIWNLLLLSSLTLLNLVVARYRVPYLFLLVLFAADTVLRLRELPEKIRLNIPAAVSFGVMMVMLAAIYAERFPRLGSWY